MIWKSITYSIVLAILMSYGVSCSSEQDHFLECVQTRGRRPCEPMSMKYDSKKGVCGCNTKHRGWITWETNAAR